MLFYNFLWTLIGGPLLVGCQFYRNPRLQERLAFKFPRVPSGRGGIWIHALSVGEVKSAQALVKRIKKDYPEVPLVFSSTTRQGLELARNELSDVVDMIITMPFDFWWSYHRIIRFIRPQLFLLVETDLWPGILVYLRARGIQSLLVNGRISKRTYRSYKRTPTLARKLFSSLEVCLMQTKLDSERLLSIGLPPHKVVTIGNIKFDRARPPLKPEEKQKWKRLFGLPEDATVWVAGSTHGQESLIILDVFFELQKNHPNLVLILAPRKIEQAQELNDMAIGRGKTCLLRSQSRGNVDSPDVVILDSVGELERIYGLGDISFVGGSLVPFGGHNLLEPASFSLPVLFGPHTDNFAWMSDALEGLGGGRRVKDPRDLTMAIRELLSNNALRAEMGSAAQCFVKQNEGAVDRVMNYVEASLRGRVTGC